MSTTDKNKTSIEDSPDDEITEIGDPETKVTRSGNPYGGRDDIKVNAVVHSEIENNSQASSARSEIKSSESKKDKANKIKALQLKIRRLRLEEELAELQDSGEDDSNGEAIVPDCLDSTDQIEEIQDNNSVVTNNSERDRSHEQIQISPQHSVMEMVNLQAKFMEEMVKQQQQNALALSLPNTEVPIFHGDPIDYNPFISAFENIIEKKTHESSARLYYLIQYTSGEVKEVLQSCLPMNPTEGYNEARKILKKRYGQNYRIASAHVDKLLNSQAIKSEDGKGLMKLATMLTTCKNTLKEMGYISKIENPDTLRKIISLLPFEVRRRWRTLADSITEREDREIIIDDIVKFVEKEARVTTHPVFGDLSNKQPVQHDKKPITQPQKKSSFMARVQSSCFICGSSSRHQLEECRMFKQHRLKERHKLVMSKGLCFNCLCHGHRSKDCTASIRCEKCKRRHNVLLHQEYEVSKNVNGHKNQDNNTQVTEVKNAFTQTKEKSLIGLPIVPVKIKNGGMKDCLIVNALLDNGSNSTFCTEKLLEKLGKTGISRTISLTTIDKESILTNTTVSNLQIYDMEETYMIDLPTVLSRPNIPVSKEDIPTQEDIRRWPHLHGIHLPKVEAEVELLIGNDNIAALEPKEIRKSKDGGPYAVRTNLGWAVNGPIGRTLVQKAISNFIKCEEANDNFSLQFKDFCNREFNDSLVERNKEMSQEDRRAISLMEDTIQLKNGQYEVGLPWREYPPLLPDNKVLAMHRLNLLKRKLLTDPNLFEKYGKFMDDLVQNRFAEMVNEDELKSDVPSWYLPHHSVVNPYKPLKTRIVFDCSAKYKETSLNQCLLQGPNLTNTLVGVLSRFRLNQYACMADISSMYHMVKVPEGSRNVLKFLWWPNKDLNSEPATLRMTVHCVGMISSPSCCNFALRKVAEDPEMSKEVQDCIKRHFYVDDFLRSFKTEEEAKMINKELCQSLSNKGFQLQKWVSNSQEIINSIPEKNRGAILRTDQLFEDVQIERTLGIRWNINTDSFGFNISIKPRAVTRRGLLSSISSIFDPLGFVAPCILPAKKILHDLCKLNFQWDTPIPSEYNKQWNQWLTELPKLSKLSVKRCFVPHDFDEVVTYQLHHMSDASEIGYGSVTYLRMIDTRSQIHVAFLIGKSRLTPLKRISIPRLELSAATISVRLDTMMREELEFDIDKSVFWTDSTSVLKYIRNETKRFHTFVANRIAMIRDGSIPSDWHYVDSKSNPSDDASRGLLPGEFIKNQRWILGPGFLYLPEEQWPKEPDIKDITTEEHDPEIKLEKKCNLVKTNGIDAVYNIITRVSSWLKLRKCIAYFLRFKRNLLKSIKDTKQQDDQKKHKSEKIELLTLDEVRKAEEEIIKIVQQQNFPDEYKTLTDETPKKIKKSSNIISLDPVVLEDNLIRVGGRLRNSYYSTDFKHPVILPQNNHVSNLIIEHYHHISGHSGREYVLSLMRRRYWIVNANSAVRSVLSRCISCKKRQAQPIQQKLSNLPEDRIIAGKPPITSVGVDFFGPFMVKRGRSLLKRYGCIFTCMAIRAIHIEITQSMNTDSFINALRRFIARRGAPETIRTDNGTNFVGGYNELKSAIREWNQKKINDFLVIKEVKWIFNTPTASHHGGVWERCIKTIRKILNALLTEQVLDDEGLSTLMCEVESIVNGRPITTVSDDVTDLEALTPNHILLMKSSPTLPPGFFVKKDLYIRKKWRQVQYMADVFWTRWKSEYLPLLQKRQKWFTSERNTKIGDVILLVDDSLPRSNWPLARVVDVKTGKDGLVRSVKVKTKTSTFERPVTKCIQLESTHND